MKRITFLKKGISLVCAILMLTAVLPTALAAEYTARKTPAQRQRFEKLLGQYGMTLA